MDPVEIQTSIVLSRIAAGDIPFGRAVERAGANGEISVYGGAYPLEDGSGAWTAEAEVTRTNPAGTFDTSMLKLAITNTFTTGVIASLDIAAMDMSIYEGISILIKPSIDVAAGVLQFGVSETAALGGSPILLDLPAMEAGKWYYVSATFTGVAGDRDAVLSFGLNAASDPGAAIDLYVQFMGLGAKTYDIAGFAKDDQAKEGDEAEQYDDVKVLAAGHINADLATGITCVAEQQLYPIPGTGLLHTTEIVTGGREVSATEDQATPGGRVGVRL